jgi:hypothetical protein
MLFHTIRIVAMAALLGSAAGSAYAAQTLDADVTDTCSPGNAPAAEMRTTLPDGRLFIASIWQLDRLEAGLKIKKQDEAASFGPGNARICADPERTTSNDCKAAGIRINIIDTKDGDIGAGTLYIEGMGTFSLNVRWTHTPRFCG